MADNDTVSDVEDVEQTGSTDIDEVLLLAFLAFGIVFILAIVFDPKQVEAIVTPTGRSFFAPALAFIHGIYDFIISFFTGIINKILGSVTSGASSIGSDIYKNTIGRI